MMMTDINNGLNASTGGRMRKSETVDFSRTDASSRPTHFQTLFSKENPNGLGLVFHSTAFAFSFCGRTKFI